LLVIGFPFINEEKYGFVVRSFSAAADCVLDWEATTERRFVVRMLFMSILSSKAMAEIQTALSRKATLRASVHTT
jgi:hypothetical protein